jgi:dienelactone hydrolase
LYQTAKIVIMNISRLLIPAILPLIMASCHDNHNTPKAKASGIKEEDITYSANGVNMIGFAAYDSVNMDKRPVVLIVHEWWGLNDYIKMRARELAKLGYLAFAVDMYGNRTQGESPDSAGKLASAFYTNPQLARERFNAALLKIKSYAQADTAKVAAIGYCFGGAVVIGVARLGENLDGVVSFHGNLNVVPAVKDQLKADVLVCHGGADPFVPQEEVNMFKKQMDSIGAKYTFKVYEGATHAFTNPDATSKGEKYKIPIKYDAAADSASWKDMQAFFGKIFK